MQPLNPYYDGIVIGGGITGMQAALDIAEQGFKVLLVETEPSIGGKMIALNKVFPTLDCSSCICTPRMAESAHHHNIQILTYADVKQVEKRGKGFSVRIERKPRYVVEEDCIGCSRCEQACPVDVPHEFDYGLGVRRAIYIPHGNAIPQVAVLDVDHCTFCGKCEKVCPTNCIDYAQTAEMATIEAGTVIVSTGLKTTPRDAKPEYGQGKFINVMDPLAMERVQSSNGPYGRVLRPSDGKIPRSIAYIQCAGSRDKTLGVPYCSRVCCMYSIKQAILLLHLVHGVEITIYHMDIRAFGKNFEQFYQRAKDEGIRFVKGKVAKIDELPDKSLKLRVEDVEHGGKLIEPVHDLVVLALGIMPGWHGTGVVPIEEAQDGFFLSTDQKLSPVRSTMDGIYVAGVAMGPKDIPDAIVEAGAAAMEAAMYLQRMGVRRVVHPA
jgi:heterodisulfide reductase subunit A2